MKPTFHATNLEWECIAFICKTVSRSMASNRRHTFSAIIILTKSLILWMLTYYSTPPVLTLSCQRNGRRQNHWFLGCSPITQHRPYRLYHVKGMDDVKIIDSLDAHLLLNTARIDFIMSKEWTTTKSLIPWMLTYYSTPPVSTLSCQRNGRRQNHWFLGCSPITQHRPYWLYHVKGMDDDKIIDSLDAHLLLNTARIDFIMSKEWTTTKFQDIFQLVSFSIVQCALVNPNIDSKFSVHATCWFEMKYLEINCIGFYYKGHSL